MQRRIEGLLQEHLDRMHLVSGDINSSASNIEANELDEYVNTDKNDDSFLDRSVMEKILIRQSLRMQNMQRAWQVLSLI